MQVNMKEQVNMEDRVKKDPLTLTNLSNELLIEIYHKLPQANLNALNAVCRKLRNFVKNNGDFICKKRVASYYQDAIALLELEKDENGWYLPHGTFFKDIEGLARANLIMFNTHTYNVRGHVYFLKDTKYVKYLQQVDLLLPGPQMCAFLDKHFQAVRAQHRYMRTKGGNTKEKQTMAEQHFATWVAKTVILHFYQATPKGMGLMWYHGLDVLKPQDLL